MKRIIIGLVCTSFIGFIGWKSYGYYDYVEHNPKFCGTACHEVMGGAYEAWQKSEHKNINCKSCHPQNTSARFEILKAYWKQRLFQGKVEIGKHASLDKIVCQECHYSPKSSKQWAKQVKDTLGHQFHVEERKIQCVNCHASKLHQFAPPREACLTCHASKADTKAMAGIHCTTCHNFLGKELKTKTLLPDRATCLDCHKDMHLGREKFPENAPMSDFSCSTCHKPHTKPKPDFVTCLDCHSDVIKREDHNTADKILNCASSSCHAPHSFKPQLK